MKERIIERYVLSMDKKQFAEDLNEASRELCEFISSFDSMDLPVVIYLMQSYAQSLLATDEEMQNAVDAIKGLFGAMLFTIHMEKDGGTDDEL